jgi:hypothetical protein
LSRHWEFLGVINRCKVLATGGGSARRYWRVLA